MTRNNERSAVASAGQLRKKSASKRRTIKERDGCVGDLYLPVPGEDA